jgi:hypothetical protein
MPIWRTRSPRAWRHIRAGDRGRGERQPQRALAGLSAAEEQHLQVLAVKAESEVRVCAVRPLHQLAGVLGAALLAAPRAPHQRWNIVIVIAWPAGGSATKRRPTFASDC